MGNLFGNWFNGEDGNSSILFFFLLLVVLFGNCGMFEDSDSLLFFFLLLIVLFSGNSFCGRNESSCGCGGCAPACN